MQKNKILNFYRLVGIVFSFIYIVFPLCTHAGTYYEFRNLDTTQTTICGFSTKTACEEKLKSTCGTNTTGICVESSVDCGTGKVTPSCPVNSSSTNGDTYNLLAPIGGMETAPDNFGDYANKIFLLAIGICAVLAVIMIVIGGIQYMGDESIFAKTQGKEQILNAILGLIIALGAFALLNTINPDLLNVNLKIKSVSAEIDEEIHGDTPQTSAVSGYYCNGRVKAGSETTPSGKRWDSDSTERATLLSAGITVQRSTSCKKVGDSNCTSLTELATGPLISWKKTKCPNCAVVINGATECWLHSTKTYHFPGNSTVDIDDTTSMNTYVQSGTKQSTKSGYTLYTKDGVQFLYELNHYHIISW